MRSGFIRDLTLINAPPPIGALLGDQNERISQRVPFGTQKSQDASFDPQSHNMCHLVLTSDYLWSVRRTSKVIRRVIQNVFRQCQNVFLAQRAVLGKLSWAYDRGFESCDVWFFSVLREVCLFHEQITFLLVFVGFCLNKQCWSSKHEIEPCLSSKRETEPCFRL